jgi:hypothetical protein
MSWKGEARRNYEERVVNDSLTRLAARLDLKALPFSHEELKALAKRSRESFRNPQRSGERLVKYKSHLAKNYGTNMVENISVLLEEINNEIGYEEK